MVGLIVPPAQCVPYGARMIVLHKHVADAQLAELAAMVGLHEKTASIDKDFGAKFKDAGKRSFDSLHLICAPANVVTQTNAARSAVDFTNIRSQAVAAGRAQQCA